MPDAKKEPKPKKPVERVVVEIYGSEYVFKTDEPEYLRQIAAVVDQQMKQTARKARSFDATKIAVMGALEIADKYCQLRKDYDELVELLDEK